MSYQIRLDRERLLARWAPPTSPSTPTISPTPAQPDLHFGEFRLSTNVDLLFRRDEVVSLEPRAVQVLRTLALNRGQVVRKEALLDQVWPDTFVTEGVLKKAIAQIRRALGESAQGRGWIETFHRRGYRLREAPASGPLPVAAREGTGVHWLR
jgi:DNA-binding winged helix-turn-helix (wHTH) protein